MGNIRISNKKRIEKHAPNIMDVVDFLEFIEKFGDKVVFKYFKKKQIMEVTYKEYTDLVHTLSAGLSSVGLLGKRIAVIGETSVNWLATYTAIIASGGIAIPMDKELAPDQIIGFLDMVDADAIVYSESFNPKFDEYIGKGSRVYIPIVPAEGREENEVYKPFERLLEAGAAGVANGYKYPRAKDPKEMAEMLFTSGTTGTSKCVMLSQLNIYSVVKAAYETVDFCHEDVILSVLPVHHTYELACLQAGMLYGMEICINDTIGHVMRNIAAFKPTGLVLVPLFVSTIYKKIWAEAEKQGRADTLRKGIKISEGLRKVGIDVRRKLFSSVHEKFGGRLVKIICGGAKLNPEYIEGFEAIGISIYEGFGITECSPLAAVTPYYARKVGSIGTEVTCCRMRIEPNGQQTEDGHDLGELQVKGTNVMLGYYNNPEATADVFTDDGWFRTGDIGYKDEDGYYYITGRSKFVIVLENGKNVFPEEIEDYLDAIDEIAECVVLGRKAEDSDEVKLIAVVYPNAEKFAENETKENIHAAITAKVNDLNRTLPSFKQIKGVELRDTEFEKTTSRKIKRNLVK